MMKMKNLVLLLLLVTSGTAFAQDPGDFGDNDDPNPTDDPTVTIDGYKGLLAVSGILLGAWYFTIKTKK